MELEELKYRIKEKIRKKYPQSKITEETEDTIEFKVDKDKSSKMFLSKMLDEINVSRPEEWDKIIEKRFPPEPMVYKIIGFAPRLYSKLALPTVNELIKGGQIILKEINDEIALLVAETAEMWIGIPEKELIEKYGFTKEKLVEEKQKALKKLKDMGI